MNLGEYLKDKVYFIIVNLICISIIILLLLAFKVRFSLIIVVTFLLITENILLLMIDYFRKKNFYTSLIQKLEALDKKYLILADIFQGYLDGNVESYYLTFNFELDEDN